MMLGRRARGTNNNFLPSGRCPPAVFVTTIVYIARMSHPTWKGVLPLGLPSFCTALFVTMRCSLLADAPSLEY